jgi:hypothetical protein
LERCRAAFATNLKMDPAALKALREGTVVPDAKFNALVTPGSSGQITC